MRRGTWGWLVAIALAGCKPFHQPLPPRPTQLQSRTYQFPSGLRVVTESEPGSRRVAIAVLVGSGSADDPHGREGLAHFLEHLAFRSRPTRRLPAWDELDFAGVASKGQPLANGETRRHSTTFLGTTTPERARSVLPLFASLVVRPLEGVDDPTFQVERQVVNAERLESDPHSGGAVGDAMVAAVLPDEYPGSRSLSGTETTLAAISRADVERFAEEHYAPANVVVSLVGDLSHADGEALVRAAFPASWLSAPDAVEPRFPHGLYDNLLPSPPSGPRRVVESRIPYRRLILAWAVPGLAHSAGPAVPLLEGTMRVKGGRPKGVRRLWRDSALDTHVSVLSLVAELEPDASADEVSRALRGAVSFGAVGRDAWQVATELRWFGELELSSRATGRALMVSATGVAQPLERGPSDGALAGLKKVRDETLVAKNAREVLVVPRRAELAAPRDLPAPTPAPKLRLALDADALRELALGPWLGEARRFTLPNGLEVLLSRRPSVPVATVTLGLPAGALQTGRDVGALLDPALVWDRSYQRSWAPDPQVAVGPDATLVFAAGRSSGVPVMLDLLGHNLPPRVSWFTIDTMRDAVRALKETVAKAPDARRELTRAETVMALERRVLPPRSSVLAVGLDELTDLERKRFVDFVDQAWRPDGAWLVVDGDIDLAPTEAIVRELFSDWRRGEQVLLAASAGALPPVPSGPSVVERKDASMTVARFACRLPAGTSSAELGASALLSQALETAFQDDLRRARGLTYSVTAVATRSVREPNLLLVEAALRTSPRQEALREFLEKLELLEHTPWDAASIDVARWHLAKEGIASGLSSVAQPQRLAVLGASGRPAEEVLGGPLALAQAPLTAVQAAWSACVESLALEVEGERASLEAALLDAGRPSAGL